MDASNHIIFYDIASGPPVPSFNTQSLENAVNLNLIGSRFNIWIYIYQTSITYHNYVTSVRKKLGAETVQKDWDGSPLHTLPVIQALSTGAVTGVVGDTFDIALYLDKTYPKGPSLLPLSIIGLLSAFSTQVDAIFS
ncbi:hypothetical protein K435DRAFT_880007 [Dendrothele bispora CBS 962.96]|uniref:GST N-terminal domain-containing protein n=1 Tax=Dendrothele bispora (strain CBS 962.96) TaxID=1314807 RepID=A0A4S8KK70_DENBC|nr:hypothetical protein K435DRAFT_880007 [Dendrothele bispora CBS 962.96]